MNGPVVVRGYRRRSAPTSSSDNSMSDIINASRFDLSLSLSVRYNLS